MSTSSPEDATTSEPSPPGPAATTTTSTASAGSSSAAAAHEPLACVSCRSRKLKCDRQKPVCARCVRAGAECVYPESRRKPAFKRRNVRELEERLAQVEGLLKTVGKQRAGQSGQSDGAWTEDSSPGGAFVGGGGGESSRFDRPRASPTEGVFPWIPPSPTENPPPPQHGELLGLGQFETLPPFEMIEELHQLFFETQQHFLPIIHPGNYLRSFHSPPHMRPPLCLQYAIWTVASNGHPKYGSYHDALYRRARQYLDSDELKDHGEHFITIGHSQAWALVATDEARCLLFTRASMSSARSIRLNGMMGLHRLDSSLAEEEVPMAPMIAPPRNWAELEERRRLFWGGFCIDSYAGISAGWPSLIDVDQITTHLPVSEAAFTSGVEEKSSTLQDAFRGAGYSIFASNAVVCHIFTRLMKHAHRPMPDDHPEDPEFGPFWKRHRELDNMLSSAFMFLPERFRLPLNMRDPIAVQANMNLHGAVICLHIAAREKADKFKLPGLGQASRTRSLTAAQEIIDIIKASGHARPGYRGPLMALSLFFAASVYATQAKENPEDLNKANLELLIECMGAIGSHHVITHAYLRQLLLDLQRHNISVSVSNLPPNIGSTASSRVPGHDGIPLVARSLAARNAKMQHPLPGRLPLGAPQGTIPTPAVITGFAPCAPYAGIWPDLDSSDPAPASKRMRTSSSNIPTAAKTTPSWSGGGSGCGLTFMDPAPDQFEYTGSGWAYATKYTTTTATTNLTNLANLTNMTATLPHRTGSPAVSNPSQRPPPPPFTVGGGFHMGPGDPPFPPLSDAAAFGLDTSTAANPNPTTTSSNPAGATGSATGENQGLPSATEMALFENMAEWGVTDPEALYAMLIDVTAGEGGMWEGMGGEAGGAGGI